MERLCAAAALGVSAALYGVRTGADLARLVTGEYEVDGVRVDDPVAAVDELVSAHLAEIRTICATYPVGTVVSRLGQLVAPRHLADAA